MIAKVRHLLSFTAGSALGLVVDLGGFFLLNVAGVAPGVANAISSFASIVVVYLFVTRRTFRARWHAGTFAVFLAWYAANIAVTSFAIEWSVLHLGGAPMFWKLVMVPISFTANYVFNIVLHRVTAMRGRRSAATAA